MKRDLLVVLGCIVVSGLLFSLLLSITLKYSRWGQFVLDPKVNQANPATVVAKHGDVLPSLQRQVLLFHLLILPVVCAAVGLFSGALARKPSIVAFLGVLPFRLFYLKADGLHILTILSTLIDVGIAVGCALILVHFRRRRKLIPKF